MGFGEIFGNLFSGGSSGGGLFGTIGGALTSVWEGAKFLGGAGVNGLTTGLKALTAGTTWVRDSLKGIGDSSLFKGIGEIGSAFTKTFKEVAGIAGPTRSLLSLLGGYPPGATPAQIYSGAQGMGPAGLPPGFGQPPGNPGDRAFAARIMEENRNQWAMSQMGYNGLANYSNNVMTGMMLRNAARNLFG